MSIRPILTTTLVLAAATTGAADFPSENVTLLSHLPPEAFPGAPGHSFWRMRAKMGAHPIAWQSAWVTERGCHNFAVEDRSL